MFNQSRRAFLQRLLGLSLLGGMVTPAVLASGNHRNDDRLLMVNGWVILESDLH